MKISDLKSGQLCVMSAPTICTYLRYDSDQHLTLTASCELNEGAQFILLSAKEINVLNVIDCQVFYNNLIMSFNIYYASSILDDVRAAELYDIPFKLLQSVEPGSNSLDAS